MAITWAYGNQADVPSGNYSAATEQRWALFANGADVTIAGAGNADVLVALGANDVLNGGTGADFLIVGNEYLTLGGDNVAISADYVNTSNSTAANGTLYGGIGADTLVGAAGADALYGGNDADRLYAGNGADVLDGGAGADYLYGGAGDDILYYDSADNIIDGGAGQDTLVLGNSAAYIDLNGNSKFAGIEVVVGGNGADTIYGTAAAAETLFGGAGNDILAGLGADDSLAGGAGNDTFVYGAGYGNDIIADGNNSDAVYLYNVNLSDLGLGTDTDVFNNARGLGSVDMALSAASNPTETLTLQNWFAASNAAPDSADVARTFVTADNTRFNLYMANNAAAFNFTGANVTELVYGSDLGEALNGGADTLRDTIFAGAGNDTITYHAEDVIYGGTGARDLVTAETSKSGVVIDLSKTIVTTGNVSQVDDLTGSSLADTLVGTTGDNILRGESGADQLYGAAGGNDTLVGGIGADTYFWTTVADGTTETVTIGNESAGNTDVISLLNTSWSDLTFTANGADLEIKADDQAGAKDALVLENWIATNASGATANSYRTNKFVDKNGVAFSLAIGNETAANLYGTSGSDFMQAGAGNAVFVNSGGADAIYGNEGNDFVYYDSADFIIDGGNGTDVLTAQKNAAGIFVDQASTLGGRAFGNMEVFIGSSLADSLAGNAAAESLTGGSGADLLYGATGNDLMVGGYGADTFFWSQDEGNDIIGDAGNNAQAKSDVISIARGSLDNIQFNTAGADLTISFNDGGAPTDSLTLTDWLTNTTNRVSTFLFDTLNVHLGVANDTATTLKGTSGVDYLYGGAGNDLFSNLGAGADTVNGGAGNDKVNYTTTAAVLNGGNDVDTLTAVSATAGVVIDAAHLFGSTQAITNFELIEGSSLADSLIGTSAAETINGGVGADMLLGYQGNDTLLGGIGADTYFWGPGQGEVVIANDGVNNRYDAVNFAAYGVNYADLTFASVNSNNDLAISFTSESGLTDTLTLEGWMAQQANGANANSTRISTFIAADKTFGLGIGTTGSDTIKGTSLADYINGDDGADSLSGAGGADTILGGAGDDTIVFTSTLKVADGGEGTDMMQGSGMIDASGFFTSGVTIANIEYIQGGTAADSLAGSTMNETLYGGAGADMLWGGAFGEDDTLIGGTGIDTYYFGANAGNDVVAAAADNSADKVALYDLSTSGVTASYNGSNLTLAVTSSGNTLTLENWGASGSGYKLNQFVFSDGTYQLTGSDSLTWTRV